MTNIDVLIKGEVPWSWFFWCKCIVEAEEKWQDRKLKVINNVGNRGRAGRDNVWMHSMTSGGLFR